MVPTTNWPVITTILIQIYTWSNETARNGWWSTWFLSYIIKMFLQMQRSFLQLKLFQRHESDLTGALRHPESPAIGLCVQQLVQNNIKENIYSLHHWQFVMAIHQWLVDSAHKGPVMKIAFICHNVIINSQCQYMESEISQQVPKLISSIMSLKINLLKLHLPGANELIST